MPEVGTNLSENLKNRKPKSLTTKDLRFGRGGPAALTH